MNGLKSTSVYAVVVLISVLSLVIQAAPDDGKPLEPTPQPAKPVVDDALIDVAMQPVKGEAKAGDICQCVGPHDTVAAKKIEIVLDGPLHSMGLDYTDQPLQDVVNNLQDEYSIPIQINRNALEEAGIAIDQPVSVTLHNISLRSAIKLMLRQNNLTTLIQDEVLVITTGEDAEKHLVTCVYNVQGAVDESDKASMETLINAIQACVAPDTWSDNGGTQADIRALRPGLLVVSQTPEIHEQVKSLILKVRKMRETVPVTKSRKREPEAARSQPGPTSAMPVKRSVRQANKDPRPGDDNPFGG